MRSAKEFDRSWPVASGLAGIANLPIGFKTDSAKRPFFLIGGDRFALGQENGGTFEANQMGSRPPPCFTQLLLWG